MNQTAAVGSLQVEEAPSQVEEAAVTLVAVTASKDLDNFLTKS